MTHFFAKNGTQNALKRSSNGEKAPQAGTFLGFWQLLRIPLYFVGSGNKGVKTTPLIPYYYWWYFVTPVLTGNFHNGWFYLASVHCSQGSQWTLPHQDALPRSIQSGWKILSSQNAQQSWLITTVATTIPSASPSFAYNTFGMIYPNRTKSIEYPHELRNGLDNLPPWCTFIQYGSPPCVHISKYTPVIYATTCNSARFFCTSESIGILRKSNFSHISAS